MRGPALLRIMLKHLEVTEALLDHYAEVAAAVSIQPSTAGHLPAFERRPTLQELHALTTMLRQQVQSILDMQ